MALAANATTLSWIEDQIQKSKKQKEQILGTIQDVEAELTKFRQAKVNMGVQGRAISEGVQKIYKGDPVKARHFIRQVFDLITVHPGGRICLKWRLSELFTAEEKSATKEIWLRF